MTSVTEPPGRWLSFSLAFVGGFGDAAGFVLAKTFTGHITGAMVLAAVSLAAQQWTATAIHLSSVAFFSAGILLSVLFARIATLRRWPALLPALSTEVVLISVGCLALMTHVAGSTEILVICLSLALGLQNGAFRYASGISVHTTYLTGMVTGLLVSQTEKLFSQTKGASIEHDTRAAVLYGTWGSFFLGAVAGAALVFRFREVGIFAIVVILIALIILNATTVQPERPAS